MTTEQQGQVAKKELKPIDTVRHALQAMQPQFTMALPKHITAERMVRVALTAIQNTPKLLDCDRKSLYSAVMRAAQLGLEPDGILGQAYLIPYGKTVQFIPGYKGLIDLARRSGDVSNIIAKEVCENDEFTVDFSQEIPFVHKPKLDGDRGQVTHFWAMARFKDGGFHWDYMTKKEVEAIRDKGNGAKNAVWKEYFVEMGKKTVIRRIAKFLPMSVQRAAVVEDLIDAGKKFTTSEMGDIIIEGDMVEETEGSETEESTDKKASKLDKFSQKVDSETGEITNDAGNASEAETSAADDDDDVPAALRHQPHAVPVKFTEENKPDWEAFTVSWQKVVKDMTDIQSLNKLVELNKKSFVKLGVDNPPKHGWCMEVFTNRIIALGGAKDAA